MFTLRSTISFGSVSDARSDARESSDSSYDDEADTLFTAVAASFPLSSGLGVGVASFASFFFLSVIFDGSSWYSGGIYHIAIEQRRK